MHRFKVPAVDVAWQLGRMASVSYIATRDGETFEYVHKFKPRSRPLLVASDDGAQLVIVGGRYRVTDHGIVDF